jgi:UDP-glucuronate decarboxylase
MTRPKNILVTGGAGFLGSHLVDRLLTRGDRVTVVDNLYTGSWDNLAPHRANNSLERIEQDIIEPLNIAVDEIYNLACPASPVHYQADPVFTFRTSVWGAYNLLELARSTGAKILQASTSEVYGDPLEHPQPEAYWGNVNSFGTRSCYDEGKRGAETLFHDFHHRHGVDIRIVRIFNTYGPRMDPEDGRVVSNFITQALRGDDITIYGDGSQTRAFCYVDDLIDGMIALMDKASPCPAPLNLGNDGEFTVAELADMVIGLTDSKSKIMNKPMPADDPKLRQPDLTQARAVLGFEPKIQLREGLIATIAYFKSIMTQR